MAISEKIMKFVCKELQTTPGSVRLGIRYGQYDWGNYRKSSGSGGGYSYSINPVKFKEYFGVDHKEVGI